MVSPAETRHKSRMTWKWKAALKGDDSQTNLIDKFHDRGGVKWGQRMMENKTRQDSGAGMHSHITKSWKNGAVEGWHLNKES